MPLVPFADPAAMPEKTSRSFERLPRPLNSPPHVGQCRNDLSSRHPLRQRDPNQAETLRGAARTRHPRGRSIRAAFTNSCSTCRSRRNAGCRDDQVAALEAARFDDKAFDDAEKAMLRLTREIVLDVRASQAAVNAAQKFFDPQEIIEIICTVGFYMTIARLTETTRIEIDAPSGVAIPHFEKIR